MNNQKMQSLKVGNEQKNETYKKSNSKVNISACSRSLDQQYSDYQIVFTLGLGRSYADIERSTPQY